MVEMALNFKVVKSGVRIIPWGWIFTWMVVGVDGPGWGRAESYPRLPM